MKRCDAYVLWTTDSDAYTYYEKKPNETNRQAATYWHNKNVAKWASALKAQRAENPNLHRRLGGRVQRRRSRALAVPYLRANRMIPTKFQAFSRLYEQLFPFEQLPFGYAWPKEHADQTIHKDGAGVFRRFGRTIFRSQYGSLEKLKCQNVAEARQTMRLVERFFS